MPQELRLQAEKIRVYVLARELDMESKDLLDMCRQAGFDVKNQLSSLEPEQRVAIEALVRKGSRGGTAVAAPPAPTPAALPTDISGKVRVLPTARPRPLERKPETTPVSTSAPVAPVAPISPAPPVTETKPPVAPVATPAEAPVSPRVPEAPAPKPAAHAPPAPPKPAPVTPTARPATPPAAQAPPAPMAPPPAARPPETHTIAAKAAEPPARPPEPAPKPPPTLGSNRPPVIGAGPRTGAPPMQRRDRQIRPTIVRAAAPPPLKNKLTAKPPEQKKQEPIQKPIARPVEALNKGNLTGPEAAKLLHRGPQEQLPDVPVGDIDDTDDDGKGKKRPGHVPGRDARHKERNQRAQQRKEKAQAEQQRPGRITVDDDDDTPRKRLAHIQRKMKKGTQPRTGKVPIELPITVRKLSEATGAPVGELLRKMMMEHGVPMSININSTIDPTLAELLAGEKGVELEIKRPPDAEEQFVADLEKPSDEANLVPRAPIVAVMGHVDHGKTSLLDKIRKSNIVATEAGGITQVIRAWRVEHGGRPITFLDTPGHEAFTKMRARGAQVTDIAVIVVAANDGVMPQTEEAISHAKAAGVSLVMAINKVDLPNANLDKTRRQLYNLEVLPDNMGGDTPFVETSAATGKGIDELLDQLSVVAELKELKADPTRPGSGTCLEAMLSEGEGVRATLLVRSGTLRRGDIVVCGATYGRVRQMYDDQGRPIQEAGPSVPVRITGLDEVPNADDPFMVVPELTVAREIAEKRKAKQDAASIEVRAPVTLEKLSEAKVAELKVILKADFRGSIEAIKKELEKLKHDEVRVKVLHTAIGGITESDVVLALTSPSDTIIVGFNVVPDDRAKALAEERGVQIREYDIIYNLTDDIKQALEGKLKPHEQVIHLGRAVVRQTFKISRVGTVAGCYVTQGTIERSAKVRLIRNGVVIYPPTDRTASLESLKRHKDDAREVREGFDCGMKIAGYDDLKVDDVIEAYRIEQVQRTLE
jgi:translation initiation factor IF-2